MAGLKLTDREGRLLEEGDLVAYHGSRWGEHGEWEVHGPCAGCPACSARWERGEPSRMRLIRCTDDGWAELDCVDPASVTRAGFPLPARDGVRVLGHAREGDVLDLAWMWPGRITVTAVTPAGGTLVQVEWTAPGGVSGTLTARGGAPATSSARDDGG